MSDIEKHKERVGIEVAKRGLVSFMNDTKWLELQRAAVDELPFAPPFQRKDVLQPVLEPARFDTDVWWHGDWREGILPFYSIEWLRIRPRYLKHRGALIAPTIVDCEDVLKSVLERQYIPFVERDYSIIIFGYALQTPS